MIDLEKIEFTESSTEKLKTLVFITKNGEAYFAKGFGFDVYDIINVDDKEALNVFDITAWLHHLGFDNENKCSFPDQEKIRWSRVPLDELAKRHDKMYEVWEHVCFGKGKNTDSEEHKSIGQRRSEHLKAVLDFHEWINSFSIPDEISKIILNEVSVQYCNECDEWKDSDDFQVVYDKHKGTQHYVCFECADENPEFSKSSEI